MQSFKRPGRTAPKRLQSVSEPEPEGVEPFDADGFDGDAAEHVDAYDTLEMYRVICPDCAQPIALLADEESLPEHALCASPCLLWMDVPPEESWARGRARDGEEQRAFWDGWVPAEVRHFAEDPSQPHAALLVRQLELGYEVLPGPARASGPHRDVTHRDGPPMMW